MEQREQSGGSGGSARHQQGSGDGAGVPNAEGGMDFEPIPRWTAKDTARFWSKVDRSGGPDACWPWTGYRGGPGYGQLMWRRVKMQAHRLAWMLANRAHLHGLCACHRCDNPPCCNPAHLFLGTPADNMRDMTEKGRRSTVPSKGERHGMAKLTAAKVLAIREKRKNGFSTKQLAEMYGIRTGHVRGIVRGTHWKHLPFGRELPVAKKETT